MPSRTGSGTIAPLLLLLLLPACQGGGASPSPSAASPSVQPTAVAGQAMPGSCSGDSPTQVSPGTYQLDGGTVLPGLTVTVPPGWTCTEDSPGQFSMSPPGNPNEAMQFWVDMVAVKSSGAGHGDTILKSVGRTPSALVSWLVHNRDFAIGSRPRSVTVGQRIPMTSLVVGVSPSVHYGDHCPAAHNRCADMFVNPRTWSSGNWYGMGGRTEDRLYIGTIRMHGRTHSFFIDLDAADQAHLRRLETAAQPILGSLTLPTGTVAG
jgi:hypothetical protein